MSISVSLAIIFVLICALLYVLHRWYTSEDKLKISERRLQQKSIKLTDVAEALGLPNSDELPHNVKAAVIRESKAQAELRWLKDKIAQEGLAFEGSATTPAGTFNLRLSGTFDCDDVDDVDDVVYVEFHQELAGRQQEIVDAFNNSSRGDLVMSGTALPGRVVVSSRNAVIPATVSAVRDLLESTVTGNGKLVD